VDDAEKIQNYKEGKLLHQAKKMKICLIYQKTSKRQEQGRKNQQYYQHKNQA